MPTRRPTVQPGYLRREDHFSLPAFDLCHEPVSNGGGQRPAGAVSCLRPISFGQNNVVPNCLGEERDKQDNPKCVQDQTGTREWILVLKKWMEKFKVVLLSRPDLNNLMRLQSGFKDNPAEMPVLPSASGDNHSVSYRSWD